jgi:hypothetical protein
MNLGHVPADHNVRQPAGGGKVLDVLPGRLRVALVAERQRPIQKLLPGLRANGQQLLRRKSPQRLASLPDFPEIAPHDSGVHLADLHQRLAGAMIQHIHLVQTLVVTSPADRRYVRQRCHHGPSFFFTLSQSANECFVARTILEGVGFRVNC